MVTRGVRLLSVVILFLMATGCHSIHSRSVRDLIQLEGTKIDAAQTNIDLFQKETEARIKFLEQARSSLHESFKSLQIQETKHRFALVEFGLGPILSNHSHISQRQSRRRTLGRLSRRQIPEF